MGLSRNAPCHCGSGKKYKKCCLGKLETGKSTVKPMSQQNVCFESDIDELTNETIELIEKGEFEKAEANCRKLMNDFPDYIDVHERYGDLYSATGQFEKAIESYKNAIQYMKTNPGFDEDGIELYQEKIEELKSKLSVA